MKSKWFYICLSILKPKMIKYKNGNPCLSPLSLDKYSAVRPQWFNILALIKSASCLPCPHLHHSSPYFHVRPLLVTTSCVPSVFLRNCSFYNTPILKV